MGYFFADHCRLMIGIATSVQIDLAELFLTMASNKEHLTRFECVARVLAQLNHPNFLSDFGFDQHDDILFLGMERGVLHSANIKCRIQVGPRST